MYIGQTDDLRRRSMGHISDLKLGTHPHTRLQSDYNLHGVLRVDRQVLLSGSTRVERMQEEDSLIEFYRSCGLSTNKTSEELVAARSLAIANANALGHKLRKGMWSSESKKRQADLRVDVKFFMSPSGEMLITRHSHYAPSDVLRKHASRKRYDTAVTRGPFKGWYVVDPAEFEHK